QTNRGLSHQTPLQLPKHRDNTLEPESDIAPGLQCPTIQNEPSCQTELQFASRRLRRSSAPGNRKSRRGRSEPPNSSCQQTCRQGELACEKRQR
ncbi:hypothetical protein C9890_0154, partial [Perkinsus sp. BL_2016]